MVLKVHGDCVLFFLFRLTGVSESQLEQARGAIEQDVLGRVYPYALYPNGDGDMCRDQ